MIHQTEDQPIPQTSLSHLHWAWPETRRKAAELRAAAAIEWRNSRNAAVFEDAVKMCRLFVPVEKRRELAMLMAKFADAEVAHAAAEKRSHARSFVLAPHLNNINKETAGTWG